MKNLKSIMSLILATALTATLVVGAAAASEEPILGGDSSTWSPYPLEETEMTEEKLPNAAGQYDIIVNGVTLDAQGCVMVPLRKVAEAMGYTVTWHPETQSITLDNGDMHTEITLGVDLYFATTSHEDLVGMTAPFSLGVPPYCVNGVTYVPLGLFEVLEGNVEGLFRLEGEKIVIDQSAGDQILGDDPSTWSPYPLEEAESVQIPNPIVPYTTMADAAKVAGFDLAAPETVKGFSGKEISVIGGELIQIVFSDGEGNRLFVRKAVGSEDISGDYNVYAASNTVSVGGNAVTLKGDDGLVSVALWTAGEFTYAISMDVPVTAEAMTALVAQVR